MDPAVVIILCAECRKPLFGFVNYCPHCGGDQHKGAAVLEQLDTLPKIRQ